MFRVIEFFVVFVFCYLIYFFGIMLNKKRKKFNPNKLKVEEAYLISKYNLDMNKINYKKYLNLIALSNSLIFSITLQIVTLVNGILWEILFSIAVLTPLIIFVYSLIGNYYKNKGCVKDAKIIDEGKVKKTNSTKKKKGTSKENNTKKRGSGKNV